MSPRENVDVKARRLLTEGRVIVTAVDGRRVRAVVRGDSGSVYEVLHEHGAWICPCLSRGVCSHVQAVMLVTAPVRVGVKL